MVRYLTSLWYKRRLRTTELVGGFIPSPSRRTSVVLDPFLYFQFKLPSHQRGGTRSEPRSHIMFGRTRVHVIGSDEPSRQCLQAIHFSNTILQFDKQFNPIILCRRGTLWRGKYRSDTELLRHICQLHPKGAFIRLRSYDCGSLVETVNLLWNRLEMI